MSDLIIEGAKGLPDGLYMKKDGLLFKYKPNGGTVYTARAYRITDRPKGKWVDADGKEVMMNKWGKSMITLDSAWCSECGGTHLKEVDTYYGKATWIKTDFCPNCGADMRGEDE